MTKNKLVLFISILGICAIGILTYTIFAQTGAQREIKKILDEYSPYECVTRDNPHTPNEEQAVDESEKIEEIISLLINNVSKTFDKDVLDMVKTGQIGEDFKITLISTDEKNSIDITGFSRPEAFIIC